MIVLPSVSSGIVSSSFFDPKKISGLALWLKADAGVSKFSFNYISEIIITGTSNPSFAGTYTVNGVPTYNFEEGFVDSYYFTGPAGKTMSWSADDGVFVLNSSGETSDSFTSANGVNWTAVNSYISQIEITGFTGTYAGANGTYSGSNGYFERVGGGFFIQGNELKYTDESESVIAIAPANYSGSWTPTNYVSSVTLTGAATTSVNGTYTRADTLGDTNNFALGSTLIKWEGSFWFLESLTSPFYPYVINSFELAGQWIITTQGGSPGASPAPSGSTATSARSVGSPTSATSTTPSGSISGIVTTSNVITDTVGAWADQSASGRNASINNYGPTYSLIGDKSFITFPEASTMLVPVIWDEVAFVGTIIVMARFASSNVGLLLAQDSSSGLFEFGRGYSSTNAVYIQASEIDTTDTVVSSSVANNNTNYVIGTTFDTSSASLYLNGTSVGTSSVPLNADIGYNDTIIGGSSSIAEIIVYNRVLTTPERQQVEAYLNSKYAIY